MSPEVGRDDDQAGLHLARQAGCPAEEFHRYWREDHAALVASLAETVRARKYVQSHTIDTPLNDALVQSRGMTASFEGITEVWWDSLEDMQAAMTSPEGAQAAATLAADEATFIDLSRSTMFVTEEISIFDKFRPGDPDRLAASACRRVRQAAPRRASEHRTRRPNAGEALAPNDADQHVVRRLSSDQRTCLSRRARRS